MPSEAPTTRVVVCCGLDAASAEVAAALGQGGHPPGVVVRSYRAETAPGRAGPAWEVYDGSCWQRLAEGEARLYGPVVDALRTLGEPEGTVSGEAILIVSDNASPSRLRLERLLDRLREDVPLVTAVTLVVLSTFEPATQTARGRLVRLPAVLQGLSSDVDRAVLLDEMDVRGMPVRTRGTPQETARTAALIAECTLGEFARPLLRELDRHQGHLESRGRLLSVGFASWELPNEAIRRGVAAFLAEGMLRSMVGSDEPAPEPGSTHGAAAAPSADGAWCGEVARRLWPAPEAAAATRSGTTSDGWLPDPQDGSPRNEAWLKSLEAPQTERLRREFELVGWRLQALEAVVAERSRALAELPDRAALALSGFLQRFAPLYALFATGRLTGGTRTIVEEKRVLNTGRTLACMAAVITSLVSAYGVYDAQNTMADIGLLALALGGVGAAGFIALARGFWDTERKETTITLPASDPRVELERYRDANWVANRLSQRSIEQVEGVRSLRSVLAAETSAAPAGSGGVPGALSAVLLASEGISPQVETTAFWATLTDPLAVATGDLAALHRAVHSYAYARCGSFDDLTWSQLATLLTTGPYPGMDLFDRLLHALRENAAPRMRLEGLHSGSLVAVPRDLPPEVREHVGERLGRPTPVESTTPGRLALLRYTQGYEVSSAAAAAPEP